METQGRSTLDDPYNVTSRSGRSVAVVLCGLSRSGTEATIDLVDGFRRRREPALSSAGIVSLVGRDGKRAGLHPGADRVLVRPLGVKELSDVVTEVAARSGRRRSSVSS